MKKYFVTNEKRIEDAGYNNEEILGLVLDYDGNIEDLEVELLEDRRPPRDLVSLKNAFGDSYQNVSGISDMVRCKVTTNREIFTMAYEIKDKEENKIEKKKSKMLEAFKLRNSVKKVDGVKFIKQLF